MQIKLINLRFNKSVGCKIGTITARCSSGLIIQFILTVFVFMQLTPSHCMKSRDLFHIDLYREVFGLVIIGELTHLLLHFNNLTFLHNIQSNAYIFSLFLMRKNCGQKRGSVSY